MITQETKNVIKSVSRVRNQQSQSVSPLPKTAQKTASFSQKIKLNTPQQQKEYVGHTAQNNNKTFNPFPY